MSLNTLWVWNRFQGVVGSGWKGVLLSDLPGEEHSPSQGVPVGSSSRVGRGGDWGPVGSAGRFGPREPPTHARGEQGRATRPGGQGSEKRKGVRTVQAQCTKTQLPTAWNTGHWWDRATLWINTCSPSHLQLVLWSLCSLRGTSNLMFLTWICCRYKQCLLKYPHISLQISWLWFLFFFFLWVKS